MKTMNERLRNYRKSLNLSQEYVAKQIGVSRTTITAIESGDRKVLANEINTFSNIYGVTVERILHGEVKQDSDVKMFARAFSGLSENDKKEIMNLIDFKKKLKESMI